MSAKILLVDDDPMVLAGYAATLGNDFEVDTAEGGQQGLIALRDRGPYAAILSDMRMPGMSGAQFLAQARQLSPDTVRMLLTGFADLNAVMDVINQGNIFRLLTKPCPRGVMSEAILSAVEQYRVARSEKELLEKTMVGAIKVMADFLRATSPVAFSRSLQIAHFVRHIANQFPFEFRWRLDTAATLSQLGCATLEPELIQSAFGSKNLSPADQARFDVHPEAAVKMLAEIPRLEPTAWMIGQQLVRTIPHEIPNLPADAVKETVFGASILKVSVAFDQLRVKLASESAAIVRLGARSSEFGRELIDALEGVKPLAGRMEPRRLSTLKLAAGMVLDQDIRNKQGMLLVAKGQEITGAVLVKLETFAQAGLIEKEVQALIPV